MAIDKRLGRFPFPELRPVIAGTSTDRNSSEAELTEVKQSQSYVLAEVEATYAP